MRSGGAIPASPVDNQAVSAHRPAKTTKTVDQPQPSCPRSKVGSKSRGKPKRASSEAKFESAKRRYGTALRKRRQYHDWSKGVVVESRKYGSPIVTASRIRIREIGSSLPRGFQPLEAMMGRNARETARRATCRIACRRAPSRVVRSA